jgi:hypothetical protein
LGLERYAMNRPQRTGRRSFCDTTNAEDPESTFRSDRLLTCAICEAFRLSATPMTRLSMIHWHRCSPPDFTRTCPEGFRQQRRIPRRGVSSSARLRSALQRRPIPGTARNRAIT